MSSLLLHLPLTAVPASLRRLMTRTNVHCDREAIATTDATTAERELQ